MTSVHPIELGEGESPLKSRGPGVQWEDMTPELQKRLVRLVDRERRKATRKRKAAASPSLESEPSSSEEDLDSDDSQPKHSSKTRRNALEPRFKEHKATYAGKSQQEFVQWRTQLETAHKIYRSYFKSDELKVFHAMETLKAGSEARNRALIDGVEITPYNCTWEKLVEIMQDALGTEASRTSSQYEKWMSAKWTGDPSGSLAYLKRIEALVPWKFAPEQLLHHFWRLTPAELTTRIPLDINKITREELVAALDRLLGDDRRRKVAKLQRDPGDPANPRGGVPKGTHNQRRREKSQNRRSASPANRPRTEGERPMRGKEERDKLKAKGLCMNGCGAKWNPGHECRSSSRKPHNPNTVVVAAARVSKANPEREVKNDPAGKGQAS
jgi:hypothetical protein